MFESPEKFLAWLLFVSVGPVLLVVAGVYIAGEYEWRRKMKARWAKRERASEESRLWFETRMAEIRAREAVEAQARAHAQTQPVAQTPPPPHNPPRRRMLPLD